MRLASFAACFGRIVPPPGADIASFEQPTAVAANYRALQESVTETASRALRIGQNERVFTLLRWDARMGGRFVGMSGFDRAQGPGIASRGCS